MRLHQNRDACASKYTVSSEEETGEAPAAWPAAGPQPEGLGDFLRRNQNPAENITNDRN